MQKKRRISKRCLCGCGEIVRRSSVSWIKGHKTPENKFWLRVVKKPSGCWEWTGANTGGGQGCRHGVFQGMMATHFMWEVILGREIPEGLKVLHDCDNPPCIRPDHLHLGTLSDNTKEMWARERRKCKVPKSEYGNVLALLRSGNTVKEIAAIYDVPGPWISEIKKRLRSIVQEA